MARTSKLVDRICQTYDGDESVWNISINQFKAGLYGLLGAYITEQTLVGYWALDAGEEADWDLIVARIVARSNTVNTNLRDRAINWAVAILNLYEEGQVDAFNTPDKVWTWMMQI